MHAQHNLTPLVDPTPLLEQFDGDTEILKEVLSLFISEGREIFQALQKSTESVNLPEIARLAHKMKGISADIYATTLQEFSHQLEKEARADISDHVESLTANIGTTFEEVCKQLEQWIQSH